jgi:hypothetical protein
MKGMSINMAIQLQPLECRNGRIRIGYIGKRTTEKDWFGLYSDEPHKDDWSKNIVGKNWQWAATSDSYLTDKTDGLFWIAYWTFDYKDNKYYIVASESNQYIDCKVRE